MMGEGKAEVELARFCEFGRKFVTERINQAALLTLSTVIN